MTRDVMQESGIGDRVNNIQVGNSPTMQQRQAYLNNNFNGHAPPDEFKYRSRGQAENFDQMPDPLNLEYPNDPENDDHNRMGEEEDVGPMSLTINTKEFNEHYKNQGLLQG